MIIGLDVGGTHTDVVLLGNRGIIREFKIPTNQSDLFETVLTGLSQIASGIDPKHIMRVVFSTTLTTNAIVQEKTPPVAMIISTGPGIDPELFHVSNHYHVVAGSIDHRGREIKPVNPDEIAAIAEQLVSEGVRYVGIVGKFATRNPSHELQIKSLLEGHFEKVFVGHETSGNLNFPRRIATTYLNAAVYPIHKTFFEAVQKSLGEKGLLTSIRILKPDGGNMMFDASINCPAQTILSGPAASVMGALPYASNSSESLVLDIGGTTTDMAILINGVPLLDPLGVELGGFKTLIRAMDTHSIGLGGDSLVRIVNGQVSIGPERRGKAMAFGGPAPTPTDALLVLGIMTEGDRQKAIDGLTPIAEALGTTVEKTAETIFNKICEDILTAANQMVRRINSKPVYTVHELLEGYQVKISEILVLGGPAAHFAGKLEGLSKIPVRVVPNSKVANAIGAALARTTSEITFFADTERGICTAPEDNYQKKIGKDFSSQDAVREAFELLREKALQMGADAEHLEMEVTENIQFNMVRGFYTTGRNIRTRVQIKPGLIHGYEIYAGLKKSGNQLKIGVIMLHAKHKTGLVFFPAFDWAISPTHPEREERLLYTQDQVFEEGIFDIEGIDEFKPGLCTVEDIQRVHFCVPDVSAVTTESHLISAGGAKTIGKAVLDKKVERGFALVRPPGHHAMRIVHGARGFCNINIEAVMIEYLREAYGVKKVAIVDTDCHHGDGTQDIYWHDPNTLFISIHQDGRTLYPGSGFANEMGGPTAVGTTVNIPLPPNTSEEGFLYAITDIVLPILGEFKPELIVNSAGQDNHFSDPITNMNFSAQGYADLTRLLKPDIAVLEGGYAIEGALPYVNLGIILAMAGMDYSKVVEPDYDKEKIRQTAGIMDWIKRTGETVLGNWAKRERLRSSMLAGNKFAERTRNIYYDTDNIGEQQQETLRACPDCAGALRISSSSDRRTKILAIQIPIDACPECVKQGYKWYNANEQDTFNLIYLQDRPKDEFLVRSPKR